MKAGSALFIGSAWTRLALWLFLTCSGWGISQWVPPMQSPDENQHIARAYLLGQGEWRLQAPPGKMSGGMVDAGLEEYIRQNMLLSGKPEVRFTPAEIAHIQQLAWQGAATKRYFEMPGTGYYLPLIYAPHALGLRTGEALGLHIHTSYQVTRFVVLGSSIALMIWAFSMLNPGMAVLGVLLLPMTLFQLVLPTLDGFTTALAMVVVALFARFSQPSEVPTDSWRWWGVMGLCLLLVVTSRIHLLPMVLIPFVLGWHRRKPGDAAWGLAVLLCAAAWLMIAVANTVDTRIPRDHTTTELVNHYFTAPWDFFAVLAKTWMNDDLRGFYWRSFIGVLGWLDAPLSGFFYPWISSGLLVCIFGGFSLRGHSINKGFRATLLFIATTSILLIFFALLITWTPHPTEVVAGVQGRYFIVPALLLGYALHGFKEKEKLGFSAGQSVANKPAETALSMLRAIFVVAFCTLCLVALISGLNARYSS